MLGNEPQWAVFRQTPYPTLDPELYLLLQFYIVYMLINFRQNNNKVYFT